MGLAELKTLWNAGGPWTETLDEWAESREAELPRLREIVGDLLSDESSASEFRREMDSFSKQTKYGGFHGTSGQMFLNTLVNAGAEDELGAALRSALPAPQDEEECGRKFAEFLAFVEDARERAREAGTAIPSLGYAPYFLSFFWEPEDRDAWLPHAGREARSGREREAGRRGAWPDSRARGYGGRVALRLVDLRAS